MNTYEERISLLCDMIAFAIVDGELHEREYEFLLLVSEGLGIERETFNDLFHSENKSVVIKSEFQRIQQFYRLALLMHIDGVLHKKEEIAIRQFAINMGLNPTICKRILNMMAAAPMRILHPDSLYEAFKEQQN